MEIKEAMDISDVARRLRYGNANPDETSEIWADAIFSAIEKVFRQYAIELSQQPPAQEK